VGGGGKKRPGGNPGFEGVKNRPITPCYVCEGDQVKGEGKKMTFCQGGKFNLSLVDKRKRMCQDELTVQEEGKETA